MPERLIVNASPLIFLSRVNGIGWLTGLSRENVMIPQSVVAELLKGADGDTIMNKIEKNDRFTLIEDIMPPVMISAWDLGAGETQVLSSSLRQIGSVAVLDDRAARQCGLSLNIPVVGTIGVIIEAKRRGLVLTARPVIEDLLGDGLYLSPLIVNEVLKKINE